MSKLKTAEASLVRNAFGFDHIADNCAICRSQRRWAAVDKEGQRRGR